MKDEEHGARRSFLAAVTYFLADMTVACVKACCLDGRSETTPFLSPLVSISLSVKTWFGLICPSSRIRLSPFKEKGMCVLGFNKLLLN